MKVDASSAPGRPACTSSILLKKADPRHEVAVVERNPPDATFGWGVVFSEETLGALRDADAETSPQITDAFATLDRRSTSTTGGAADPLARARASPRSARKLLLGILQRRARELGVELRFGTEVADLASSRRPTWSSGPTG